MGCSWFQREMRFDGFRTTAALLKTLDEGMKKNKLEYVDLWRITLLEQSGQHTPGEIEQMIKALETAKKQGKARFVGFSSHDRPHIKKLIETYSDIVDVVVTPYTAMSKELPKDSLFEAIRKYNIGVFGIKPFASGSLFAGDGTPGRPQRAGRSQAGENGDPEYPVQPGHYGADSRPGDAGAGGQPGCRAGRTPPVGYVRVQRTLPRRWTMPLPICRRIITGSATGSMFDRPTAMK